MGGKQTKPTLDAGIQDDEDLASSDATSGSQETGDTSVQEDTEVLLTSEMDELLAEPEFEINSNDVTESIDTLSQEIEVLKQKADENLNKAIRAQAELDNVLKRTSRDIENAHKYALEKFITELLPILDSMELGISASDEADDSASLREGMDLTLKMFITTLEKFGVKVINPQDEKFNPELHEAVSMQELEDVESGSVISVMQKGYELNGRLVRPAMVMVAK